MDVCLCLCFFPHDRSLPYAAAAGGNARHSWSAEPVAPSFWQPLVRIPRMCKMMAARVHMSKKKQKQKSSAHAAERRSPSSSRARCAKPGRLMYPTIAKYPLLFKAPPPRTLQLSSPSRSWHPFVWFASSKAPHRRRDAPPNPHEWLILLQPATCLSLRSTRRRDLALRSSHEPPRHPLQAIPAP